MEDNFYEVSNQVPEKKKSPVFNILSLIFGVVAWIPCANFLNLPTLAAIALGVVGLCTKGKYKGMAIAGLICGGIMLVFEICQALISGGATLLA